MTNARIEKVNELIKDEVSKILPEIIGEDIGLVTILKADVTGDLKKADVWVSILDQNPEEKFSRLEEKTSEIQREMGSRIKLRYTPKIELHLDKTGEYAQKIEKILQSSFFLYKRLRIW